MTLAAETVEPTQQTAVLSGQRAARGLRRSMRALVTSTVWQSRFALAAEFTCFLAALVVVNSYVAEPLFMGAFLLAYAFATGVTSGWRARLNLSVLDDLPLLVVSVAAAAGIAYWAAAGISYWAGEFAWGARRPHEVGLAALGALISIVLAKLVSYVIIRTVRSAPSHEGEHAVVLGAGRDADFLLDRLRTHREYGLRLVGQIDPQLPGDGDRLSSPAALDWAFCEFPTVRTILVTDSSSHDGELMPIIRASVARGCNVYYVPRFAQLGHYRLNAESIWGLPLQSVSAPGGRCQRALKRALDIVVAGTASLVLAPLMLVVGLLVRRETGGAMLFRQRRVGRGGREFELLKFQTLVPVSAAESDTGWNIANDDRLGPFGRFLRATSMDELPQIWNVLRGDMSLVGPRPERAHYVELFSERYSHYAERHRVPVGLTGWAQIHRLRGDTSIDDRARFDNAYCDQWSVWSDMKIILKTVPEVFRHSGG